MILVDALETGAAEEELQELEGTEALENTEVENPVEVSLNSIAGLTSPRTMKLQGCIKEQPVIALIDPGATHNFIEESLATKLGLPIKNTLPYQVRMGNGNHDAGQGICSGVLLHLQGIDIIEEFLPISLGNADVILGVKWLATLGTTQNDWGKKIMEFNVGDKRVRLQGDPTLGRTVISLKSIEKEVTREGGGLIIELSNQEAGNEAAPEAPAFIHRGTSKIRWMGRHMGSGRPPHEICTFSPPPAPVHSNNHG